MTMVRTLAPAFTAVLVFSVPLPAQEPMPATPAPVVATGRVAGRVLEEGTGAPIAGAQVNVVGYPLRAVSAIDGRYTLLNVPAGSVALSVRAVGYSPKTVEGVVVPSGAGVAQDVALAARTVQLTEITVQAVAERGTVSAALEEQRNSNSVVSSVSAQQISRSPDSDAGQAVQRVSGVTVQEGRYVFVRGLGERYTTTSLNNSRIPSPEPERRVVPLDLFPSNLLDGITTTKTFTPDQPGDFTGGQVDLRTREFPLGRAFSLSMSAGLNDEIAGRVVRAAPTVGSEWLGYAGDERRLPDAARDAGTLNGLSQSQLQQVIGAFRNAWSSNPATGRANGSISASLGGEDPVLGRLVGYIASFGYSAGQEVRHNEERALGVADGTGGARPQNEYRGETFTGTVLWGGLLNLSMRLGAATKLTASNTYTHAADNAATRLAGFNEEFSRDFDVTRLTFIERSMRSNQLRGEHLFRSRHFVDWSVTSAGVTRYEPDRSDLVYDAVVDSVSGIVTPTMWFGTGRSGTRTFSDLHESSVDLALNYRLQLSPRAAVRLGASRRSVRRDADTRAYNIQNLDLTDPERARAPELVFADPSRLTLGADANVGRYSAEDAITAGYAMLELPLGSRLRATAGARVERWALDLESQTVSGVPKVLPRRNADVLPSLALTYRLRENQNLRLSLSQTLSRPEYRELAPIGSRDIVGGQDFFGDSTLQRALVQNLDLRWEVYPSPGEVVSIGAFAKLFDQPIERILVGTTGAPTASWANASRAYNYGVELEVRRSFTPVTVFANATLMRSEIRIGNSALASLSNPNRPMVGQAPYVVNAGLGYANAAATVNATLLYNVVGRRIFEAGLINLPDTYEEARHVVDFSLRLPGFGGTQLKLDAKNLLNAPVEQTQGAVTRLRYETGRQYAVGISWQP